MNNLHVQKSYEAKRVSFIASGLKVQIAGTLDGHIDFSVTQNNSQNLTYLLTTGDARLIAVALNTVLSDIDKHCLFENDPLLVS